MTYITEIYCESKNCNARESKVITKGYRKAAQLAVNHSNCLRGLVITASAGQQNLLHVLGRFRHEVAG